MRINLCLLLFLVLLNISCNSKRAGKKEDVEKDTYANPLFMEGANSSAIYHIMVNIIIPMKLMSKYICG